MTKKGFSSKLKSNVWIQVILTIILYVPISWSLKAVTDLGSSIYYGNSFIFSAFLEGKFILSFLIASAIIIVFYKKISWKDFEDIKYLRHFVFFLALILMWENTFYDKNLFFSQNHFLDRMILIVATATVFLNPLFLISFLLLLYLSWYQFQFPLGVQHWTDFRAVFDVLSLFTAFLITKNLLKARTVIFVFLALCLHATNYFYPGIGKLLMSSNLVEWLTENRLENLFVSSYIRGWLDFLDEDVILSIASWLSTLNPVLIVISFLTEIVAIFLFANRKITLPILFGFELLHIGIFISSGIFFWSWILLNIGFIFLIRNNEMEFFYQKNVFISSIVIISCSILYFNPTPLAWFDTKMNTVYNVVVTTDKGEKIQLNRNFLAPYDMIFTQNRFGYVEDTKVWGECYGSLNVNRLAFLEKTYLKSVLEKYLKIQKTKVYKDTNYTSDELSIMLEQVKQKKDVMNVINEHGKNYYDVKKRNILIDFFKRYFNSFNNSNKHYWFSFLRAPHHIYDLSNKYLKPSDKVKHIELYRSFVFFDGKKIHVWDKELVLETEI